MKRRLLVTATCMIIFFVLNACVAKAEEIQTLPTATVQVVLPATPTSIITCSILSTEPTLVPDINSYFPPASEADFSFGPADAPVTLIEYCDFQSSGCRNLSITIAALMKNRDDVRFVFRPFPLIGVMDKSDKAVLAAFAADKQGQFWAMYDLLFVKYDEWANLQPAQFDTWVIEEAVKIGIDGDQLKAAINAPETTTKMMSAYDAAKQIGIPAVPLILINGALQPSYLLDYQNISNAAGLIALGKKQFAECPPFGIDPAKEYIATIRTERGDIIVELFANKSPLAVNSFVFLARQGWFDGVTFHRVLPGFAAQAGDPSGTGLGNPGYFFKNEVSDLKFDKPGLVGMANSGPDTNGSQFFITFAPAEHLNGGYTIFGQVINGMEIAEQLTPRNPDQGDILPAGDKIITVEIEEK